MSQFGNIHTDVWSVTSIRFEKNTLQYGKYNLELGEIHNLGKYTVQFGEIHFAIWRNTLCNLDKYIPVNVSREAPCVGVACWHPLNAWPAKTDGLMQNT